MIQKSRFIVLFLTYILIFSLFTGPCCGAALIEKARSRQVVVSEKAKKNPGISLQQMKKIENAVPKKATAVPQKPRKLLVFNLAVGYRHSSIPYAARALEIMGRKTGAFEVVQSEDMSVFLPENINQFDAVCFNNSSSLDFSDPNLRKGLMDFIKGGKGIVAIHSATNNFHDWPEAAEMMGGFFDQHPWGAGGTWTVRIEDPNHPVMAAFKNRHLKVVKQQGPNRPVIADFRGTNFEINEEIYRTKFVNLRKNCRVLMGLDMTNPVNLGAKGVRPTDKDIPISWIRSFGKGRLFYCSFGQNHHIFWNPLVLQHLLDGIQFALGDLPADMTPLPKPD